LELYGAPCAGDPRCFTDVNADCVIGSLELQCVLQHWASPAPASGACAGLRTWTADAVVGSAHLSAVIDTWANNCN
jgi:hypothetical protein